jgi:predicted dehydrogenase
LGVHVFDLWRHVLGTEVEEVFARSRHDVRDDENTVVTGLLTNGVLATAHLSDRTAHDIQVEVCGSEGRLRVACQRFDGFEAFARHETSGGLRPRLRAGRRFLRELPQGVARVSRLGDYGDSYKGPWTNLLHAIRSAETVECTVDDGRKALRVVLAAAASATTQRPVRIEDAPTVLTPARQSEGVTTR